MPVVVVPEAVLVDRLGRKYTDEEFDELCFQFGLELDEVTSEKELVTREKGEDRAANCSSDKLYKVEVPANRCDLLCSEGLTRALKIFSGEISIPTYFKVDVKTPIQLTVKLSTQCVRPFIAAAILRNVTLTAARIESLIDLQEKLHQNICR
ncbi:phenylalanyl-tRNA synthetase beta chain [Paragonimus westermani]|uniref:Phenylalanyl-tRNA synthetase beta chain n=1 Tax=Paragonimus westermani TaxID=34504 RepID=A0A5J4N9I3_9TREM|nr:phenylalanyl-tRNA synthetase beta chain [Paragonimus westermani]